MVPEGWAQATLGEVARIRGGKRMPKGRPFANEVTSFPYIRVSDFYNGSVKTDNLRYILPEDREAISRYTISSDDLYISIAGTLGVTGMIPPNLDGAQLTENAAKICEIDKSTVVKVYLHYALQSSHAQRQVERLKGVGGGVPKLALFRIEGIEFLAPPLSEQRKIAAILSSVDDTIEKTENVIAELENVKKAMMQELLTRGLPGRHRRFKETEIGVIPEDWEVAAVGDLLADGTLARVQDGNHGEKHPKAADFTEKGVPFVMARDLLHGTINLKSCNFISRSLADSLRVGFARAGDVLLSHKGTIGRVATVPDVYDYVMLTPQVTYYRVGNPRRLDPVFLFTLFEGPAFQRQLVNLSKQSTRSYIGIRSQRQLLAPVPDVEEQRVIARVAKGLASACIEELNNLRTLKNVKSALMNVLLTGELRVTPDAEDAPAPT